MPAGFAPANAHDGRPPRAGRRGERPRVAAAGRDRTVRSPALAPPRRAMHRSALLSACILFAAAPAARADFIIEVNYSGDAAFQSVFNDAAAVWEGLLSGYQDGTVAGRSQNSSYQVGETVERLFIDASVSSIDGAGGTLGRAGPNELVLDQSGFFLATDGSMQFDSDDYSSPTDAGFFEVVLHEMAHVMGFGTLWELNGVYVEGAGEFLGANANAAWNTEFGQPGMADVELGGGDGTANGHWNEVNGGRRNTGIVDDQGRDLRYELMTGWLNTGGPGVYISDMTVGSFVDIGFTAAAAPAAVPEPGTWLLIGLGGFGFALRRRFAAA